MAEEKVCTYTSLRRRKKCVYFLSAERETFFGETLFRMYTTILSYDATAPSGAQPSHCVGSKITLRHTTLCRTPLDE
jgi:hypothetical protein